MCGITGFLESGPAEHRTAVLRRMTRSLQHRGPDDEGVYVDALAALGSRRLSVIDLERGRQPMAGGRDTVHVVHNGEIYNFRTAPRPAPRPRPPVPHGLGHGGDRARLRAVRGRVRAPPRGDVRVRRLGRGAADLAARAGPDGRETAVLLRGTDDVRLRVRAAGAARTSRGPPRARSPEPGSVPRLRVRPDALRDARRHRQAAPGLPLDGATGRQAARGALLGPRRRRPTTVRASRSGPSGCGIRSRHRSDGRWSAMCRSGCS